MAVSTGRCVFISTSKDMAGWTPDPKRPRIDRVALVRGVIEDQLKDLSGLAPGPLHWRDIDPATATPAETWQDNIVDTAAPHVDAVFVLLGERLGMPTTASFRARDDIAHKLANAGFGWVKVIGATVPGIGIADLAELKNNEIPLTGTLYELFAALFTARADERRREYLSIILYGEPEVREFKYGLGEICERMPMLGEEQDHYQQQLKWLAKFRNQFGDAHPLLTLHDGDGTTPDERLADLVRQRLAVRFPELRAPADPRTRCLPRLSVITRASRRFYRGRRTEIETVRGRLVAAPAAQRVALLVLEGVSGAGKSSFVRAGLLPALDGFPQLRPVCVVPRLLVTADQRDPVLGLARVLASDSPLKGDGLMDHLALTGLPEADGFVREVAGHESGSTAHGLLAALARSLPRDLAQHLILIVDQFEEIEDPLATAPAGGAAAPDWTAFCDLLAAMAATLAGGAARPPGLCPPADPALAPAAERLRDRLTVTLALVLPRHRLTAAQRIVADPAGEHLYTLGPTLYRAGYRDVAQHMLRQVGLAPVADLLDAMAAEADGLGGGQAVLPLLSVALANIHDAWLSRYAEAADAPRTVDRAGYAEVASIETAIAILGESAFWRWSGARMQGLGPIRKNHEQERIGVDFDRMMRALVGYRPSDRAGDADRFDLRILSASKAKDPGIALLVNLLGQMRLLVPDGDGYRLAHEAVVRHWPQAVRWWEARRDSYRVRSLVTSLRDAKTPADEFPSGRRDAAIAFYRDWRADLDAEERAYLQEVIAIALRHGAIERVRALLTAELTDGSVDLLDRLIKETFEGDASLWAWLLMAVAEVGRANWAERLLSCVPAGTIDADSGSFPLLQAAQNGHAEVVRLLLERDADPNQVRPTYGTFPLLMAAQRGHAEVARLLLERHADLNQTNPTNGSFPLLIAAQQGHSDVVGLLLERHADPNHVAPFNGDFPLLISSQNGHAEVVRLLLKRDANPNQVNPISGSFPLLRAAQDGHAGVVRLLLERDADPNRMNATTGTFPLLLAAENGYAEVVRLLLEHDADPNRTNMTNGTFPLLQAARGGHAKVVRLLLERHANPNQVNLIEGNFPLLLPAQYGYAEVVRLLLERHANPNQVSPITGGFPLLVAAQQGHAEVVRLLLERDADPNQVDPIDGTFPLLLAAAQGYAEVVRLLLERDANPNRTQEVTGSFPLLLATQQGHAEVVRQLLDCNADPNQVDPIDGTFPLLLAAENSHTEVVRLLLQRDADPNQVDPIDGTFPLFLALLVGHRTIVADLVTGGATSQPVPAGAPSILSLALRRGAPPSLTRTCLGEGQRLAEPLPTLQAGAWSVSPQLNWRPDSTPALRADLKALAIPTEGVIIEATPVPGGRELRLVQVRTAATVPNRWLLLWAPGLVAIASGFEATLPNLSPWLALDAPEIVAAYVRLRALLQIGDLEGARIVEDAAAIRIDPAADSEDAPRLSASLRPLFFDQQADGRWASPAVMLLADGSLVIATLSCARDGTIALADAQPLGLRAEAVVPFDYVVPFVYRLPPAEAKPAAGSAETGGGATAVPSWPGLDWVPGAWKPTDPQQAGTLATALLRKLVAAAEMPFEVAQAMQLAPSQRLPLGAETDIAVHDLRLYRRVESGYRYLRAGLLTHGESFTKLPEPGSFADLLPELTELRILGFDACVLRAQLFIAMEPTAGGLPRRPVTETSSLALTTGVSEQKRAFLIAPDQLSWQYLRADGVAREVKGWWLEEDRLMTGVIRLTPDGAELVGARQAVHLAGLRAERRVGWFDVLEG